MSTAPETKDISPWKLEVLSSKFKIGNNEGFFTTNKTNINKMMKMYNKVGFPYAMFAAVNCDNKEEEDYIFIANSEIDFDKIRDNFVLNPPTLNLKTINIVIVNINNDIYCELASCGVSCLPKIIIGKVIRSKYEPVTYNMNITKSQIYDYPRVYKTEITSDLKEPIAVAQCGLQEDVSFVVLLTETDSSVILNTNPTNEPKLLNLPLLKIDNKNIGYHIKISNRTEELDYVPIFTWSGKDPEVNVINTEGLSAGKEMTLAVSYNSVTVIKEPSFIGFGSTNSPENYTMNVLDDGYNYDSKDTFEKVASELESVTIYPKITTGCPPLLIISSLSSDENPKLLNITPSDYYNLYNKSEKEVIVFLGQIKGESSIKFNNLDTGISTSGGFASLQIKPWKTLRVNFNYDNNGGGTINYSQGTYYNLVINDIAYSIKNGNLNPVIVDDKLTDLNFKSYNVSLNIFSEYQFYSNGNEFLLNVNINDVLRVQNNSGTDVPFIVDGGFFIKRIFDIDSEEYAVTTSDKGKPITIPKTSGIYELKFKTPNPLNTVTATDYSSA